MRKGTRITQLDLSKIFACWRTWRYFFPEKLNFARKHGAFPFDVYGGDADFSSFSFSALFHNVFYCLFHRASRSDEG